MRALEAHAKAKAALAMRRHEKQRANKTNHSQLECKDLKETRNLQKKIKQDVFFCE